MTADCVRRRDLAVVEVMKIRLAREVRRTGDPPHSAGYAREHEALLPHVDQIKRRLAECSDEPCKTVICILGENILDVTLADIQEIIRSYLFVLQRIGQLESPLVHD
jgi:hypothetical protein